MKLINYSLWVVPLVIIVRIVRWMEEQICAPIKTMLLSSMWKLSCGKNVRFVGETIIRAYDTGAIQIGDYCKFISGTKNNLVGLTNPTVICATKGARILIGDNVGCSSVVIHACRNIQIGNYVNIGGNVRIFDHDFHPLGWEDRRPPQKGDRTRVAPVVIEDDCFIGTNAIILKGTHLGARSIVAAGSVVFGLQVPADSMVKGNPAVIIKKR